MCVSSRALPPSGFPAGAVQYAVDRVEELFTLEGFLEKGPDTEGAQLAFVQPVGSVHDERQSVFRPDCPVGRSPCRILRRSCSRDESRR